MGKRSTALLLVVVLATGAAQAESLTEVYRAAVRKDPRVAAARLDHEASEFARRGALAGLLPTLSFEAENIRERQNILSSQNAIIGAGFSKFPIETQTWTITQPIFRLGAWQRLFQADAAIKQFEAQRIATEQGLMLRVASAYLGVLAAQDNLEFATAERVAVGRQLDLAQERVARGLATMVTLHDARARHAQTEAAEIEARNTLDDARQAVKEILGSLPQSFKPLRDEFATLPPDPDSVDRWVETALRQNFALEARRQAGEVAFQEVRRQRAGYFPTLNLVGTQTTRKQGGSLFGGGSHVETTDLTLRLSVPIYEGGGTTAATDEAIIRHRKVLEEQEQEARALERQTRSAYLGVLSAASRVRALSQGVVSQRSALASKQESLRSGLITLLAVLDAERDLYLVRRDFARARYDYLINRLKLAQTTGTLGDSHLESIDALLR